MYKKTFFVLLISILALPMLALADAPPPPPFFVNFTYEGQKLTDRTFYAETLRCNKEISDDVRTDIMPQLLVGGYDSERGCTWEPEVLAHNCTNSRCGFDWTLGEFKVAVYVPSLSKVFISEVINRKYLGHYGSQTQTVYDINLSKDGGVVVSNMTVPSSDIFVDEVFDGAFLVLLAMSLIATIILEAIVVLVFVLLKKAPKHIFLALLVGNVISVPFVWLVATAFLSILAVLYIVEIIAVIFEAWLIRMFSKKMLSWKMSLLISLIMNIVSFMVGPYLIYLVTIY